MPQQPRRPQTACALRPSCDRLNPIPAVCLAQRRQPDQDARGGPVARSALPPPLTHCDGSALTSVPGRGRLATGQAVARQARAPEETSGLGRSPLQAWVYYGAVHHFYHEIHHLCYEVHQFRMKSFSFAQAYPHHSSITTHVSEILKMMDFALKMMNFALKMMDSAVRAIAGAPTTDRDGR